uniref:Protein E6 n=1 Tax=Human papillomavirus TaxID=10566 RepID=A0A385PLA8_9PAPI|nr:MAG: E6 protein [Human papillomavirus]
MDTYKYELKSAVSSFLMAAYFPRRLDEYCQFYQIDFFSLRLPCIFCLFYPSLQDLADFYCKKLNIVWRKNVPYVCCSKCCKHSALLERQKFFQCSVKCSILDAVVGKPLKEIVIRCVSCFALLDYAEKLDLCTRDDVVLLVRGHWRGDCRNCALKQ